MHGKNTAFDQLSATFAALSDPTRRAILARLRHESVSVPDLAKPFDMSVPAVYKHLRVLEDAGLVCREPNAQIRVYRLVTSNMLAASQWLDHQSRS